MTILLLGAEGQVGKTIQAFAKAFEIAIHPLSKNICDIAHAESISAAFEKIKPSFVINAAAFTAVDKAEAEREKALLINGYACEHLAKVCAAHEAVLFHLSTDYVFDGESNTAYKETDDTHPLNVYGQSKHLGEQLIQHNLEKYIILRVGWIFSEFGHNFLKTMLKLAKTEETLKVVNDQRGCPTNAWHIAHVIFRVINQLKNTTNGYSGVYHYVDQPVVSWYDFAEAIIREAKKIFHLKVKEVHAIASEVFPQTAKRPKNSELNCSKIENVFHIQRADWQADLAQLIRRISL